MSQPPNTRSSSPASGTKSLICGERASVRLPRRTVPIWVSDPIGFARPRRTASTPAIVVVLTAPMPTSKIPSFPLGISDFRRILHNRRLYHPGRGRTGLAPSNTSVTTRAGVRNDSASPMTWWIRKQTNEEPLAVSLSSIKLGDRLLIVGSADVPLIVALATKAGLTGRTCMVDDRDAVTRHARPSNAKACSSRAFDGAVFSRSRSRPSAFDVVVAPQRAEGTGRAEAESARRRSVPRAPSWRAVRRHRGRAPRRLAGLLTGGDAPGPVIVFPDVSRSRAEWCRVPRRPNHCRACARALPGRRQGGCNRLRLPRARNPRQSPIRCTPVLRGAQPLGQFP